MAVCSILYQLATRPEEQEKLYEELKRVFPDPNTPLTIQLLDQCHYLKAFIKEVLRYIQKILIHSNLLNIYSDGSGSTVRLLEMEEHYRRTPLYVVTIFRKVFKSYFQLSSQVTWRNTVRIQLHSNQNAG